MKIEKSSISVDMYEDINSPGGRGLRKNAIQQSLRARRRNACRLLGIRAAEIDGNKTARTIASPRTCYAFLGR